MKRGKRYRKLLEKIEPNKEYKIEEAIKIIKENSNVKFDETVELTVQLNVNPKKQDQNVRGMMLLPHGTGKKTKICVVAQGEKYKEAEAIEGITVKSPEELVQEVQKGNINFDVLIATPDCMRDIGKIAKILGPKGLMPSPKSGTVTFEIKDAVEKYLKGQFEVRVDDGGNLHIPVGKASFEENKLIENLKTALNTVNQLKPSSVKGTYIKGIFISSTMGPGLRIYPN